MKFLMKPKYSWPEMFKDIDEYVKHCQTCAKAGNELVNSRHRILEPSGPNELWECNLIWRIPADEGAINSYLSR
ncbi:hypothetical protein PAEPH01_2016 [Pancytospora epiphaga]|nr:hypothetical protein PAEPH01_2016 [Pancytospora epiphaga]